MIITETELAEYSPRSIASEVVITLVVHGRNVLGIEGSREGAAASLEKACRLLRDDLQMGSHRSNFSLVVPMCIQMEARGMVLDLLKEFTPKVRFIADGIE